jgi:hypothetical protein
MTVKQLTVLSENSAYQLRKVISILSNDEIDIRAHCLVDNGDGHCKLRMVVSEPDKAMAILQRNQYAAVVNDVVMIETDDKPGGLSVLLEMLERDDIQIEYSYTAASVSLGIAEMVFRFSDNKKAIGVLERNGLTRSVPGSGFKVQS